MTDRQEEFRTLILAFLNSDILNKEFAQHKLMEFIKQLAKEVANIYLKKFPIDQYKQDCASEIVISLWQYITTRYEIKKDKIIVKTYLNNQKNDFTTKSYSKKNFPLPTTKFALKRFVDRDIFKNGVAREITRNSEETW